MKRAVVQSKLAKTIIGALIAIAMAVAVSYGLISQQTADKVQTQADQTLQNGAGVPPATSGQPAPTPAPQTSGQQPSQLGFPLQNPTLRNGSDRRPARVEPITSKGKITLPQS